MYEAKSDTASVLMIKNINENQKYTLFTIDGIVLKLKSFFFQVNEILEGVLFLDTLNFGRFARK